MPHVHVCRVSDQSLGQEELGPRMLKWALPDDDDDRYCLRIHINRCSHDNRHLYICMCIICYGHDMFGACTRLAGHSVGELLAMY